MDMKYLRIKWSVSRGRDTYGWNICTLWDGNTRYQTKGGGYDMTGTVFGEWLATNYMKRIKQAIKPTVYGDGTCVDGDMYGFFTREGTDKFWLDGGCGLESMIAIAEKIGLRVTRDYNIRANKLEGFMISEVKE